MAYPIIRVHSASGSDTESSGAGPDASIAELTGTLLSLPGTANNYASCPDIAFAGDIDIRFDGTLDDWTPASNTALVVQYTSTGSQRSWLLWLMTTGALQLVFSLNGIAGVFPTASSVLSISNGSRYQVRATRVASSGAIAYYKRDPALGLALDDNTNWTAVGTTTSTSGTLFNSTNVLEVGTYNSGVTGMLAGSAVAACVMSSIDGTVVAYPRFDQQTAGATSFSDSPGNTWTINQRSRGGVRGSSARSQVGGGTLIGFWDEDPDLTDVATDGSHALFLNDTTAGNRNFFRITAKETTNGNRTETGDIDILNNAGLVTNATNNIGDEVLSGQLVRIAGADLTNGDLYTTVAGTSSSTGFTINDSATSSVTGASIYFPKFVTVSDTCSATSGYAWAIGGVRAAIGSTTSVKLISNNSTAGDAMPGWIMEMQSGHAETISTALPFRRSGDSTNGKIILRGVSGAAVRPKITITSNITSGITGNSTTRITLKDFDFEKNANGSASQGAVTGTGDYWLYENMKFTSIGTANYTSGLPAQSNQTVLNCYFENINNAILGGHVLGNTIKNSQVAIQITNASSEKVIGNIIINPSTTGINLVNFVQAKTVMFNTIWVNTGSPSGIVLNVPGSGSVANNFIANNIIQGTSTAVSITGTTPHNAAELLARNVIVTHNCLYNNTNQITTGYETLLQNTVTLDPQFTNAAGGDFSIGTNLKAQGWPSTNIGLGSTRSYVDIGAAQREEQGGGGGSFVF